MELSGMTEKRTAGRWMTRYFEDGEGNIIAKECRSCREVKKLNKFSSEIKGLAGTRSVCKKCRLDITAETRRNYYEAHKEVILRNNKIYCTKNKYKIKEQNRDYYRRNWEYFSKKKQKYYVENLDKKRVWDARRRARNRCLPSSLTDDHLESILTPFNESCALTSSTEYHLDHVIPLASGHGGTIYGNIIPLRPDLNLSKSSQNIFDWFTENKERFGLPQRRFDELIEYLAEINGMTTQEYEEYVRWCHANPRSIDEIQTEETA